MRHSIVMDGNRNKKYTEIQYEIRKKEKLKEIFYDHGEDVVYVDSYRNISVALGEATDLSNELKEKGFEQKEVIGAPSLEMFLTEARFQLRFMCSFLSSISFNSDLFRHHKFEVALLSLSLAEKFGKEISVDLLAIKASVLVNLCQFEESLSIAESILSEEKDNPVAINVKADSLFNLCQFEHALVMYHRLLLTPTL